MVRVSRLMLLCALVVGASAVSDANATLVNLGPGSFTPLAPVITFSEVPLGTNNPVYNFVVPSLGGPVTVAFGGHFLGQAAGGGPPVTLIDTTPTNPLTLDPAAPVTFTQMDGANPNSPVLSGTPIFNGVIAVWFSVPVAGVGLTGGYFDALNSTTIEAYDSTGASLGTITNSILGLEFYGLADSGGANVIQGISFYITGPEPAGFAIDDLTFGGAGEIVNLIPEPLTCVLVPLGLAAVGARIRRRLA